MRQKEEGYIEKKMTVSICMESKDHAIWRFFRVLRPLLWFVLRNGAITDHLQKRPIRYFFVLCNQKKYVIVIDIPRYIDKVTCEKHCQEEERKKWNFSIVVQEINRRP